jgi:hypothetical protein
MNEIYTKDVFESASPVERAALVSNLYEPTNISSKITERDTVLANSFDMRIHLHIKDEVARISKLFEINKAYVYWYVKIHRDLSSKLKTRFNKGEFNIGCAFKLAYLSPELQDMVDGIITEYNPKITRSKMEALYMRSKKEDLTRDDVLKYFPRRDT